MSLQIKRAYHRVIFPSGKIEHNVIVVFDSDDNILSLHRFEHEEPNTIWVGGEYIIHD